LVMYKITGLGDDQYGKMVIVLSSWVVMFIFTWMAKW
jgi:hypothetical protein